MVTKRIAESYIEEIMKKLVAHGYKEDLVHLYIIGGGGCLLRNFSYLTEKQNVTVISDICANAIDLSEYHPKSESRCRQTQLRT